MPKYNIIFTSPDNDPYLWDGTSLDKLDKPGEEVLFFSGRSFHEDELKEAVKQCKIAAKQLFPQNDEPDIKTVEIKVSN